MRECINTTLYKILEGINKKSTKSSSMMEDFVLFSLNSGQIGAIGVFLAPTEVNPAGAIAPFWPRQIHRAPALESSLFESHL